jgi:hypothetical protein
LNVGQEVVLDTNVLVTANGQANHLSAECRLACISEIQSCRDGTKTVVLDRSGEIRREYFNNLLQERQRVGHEFFLHLLRQQGNRQVVRIVDITPNGVRGFDEFPSDPALAQFDMADRKFVAVSLASGNQPPIKHATDDGWHRFAVELAANGVIPECICHANCP